ncbi:hypothetical protein I79_018883 [Cricetulus griseus]|uniref:Uncharacterized protein n=1 Tax=Cricetulus griseus TaxID=10029 RepID=G3I5X2_CRIGR|nr:hypothetical protein I79_018883 [Cricetulus griseus]
MTWILYCLGVTSSIYCLQPFCPRIPARTLRTQALCLPVPVTWQNALGQYPGQPRGPWLRSLHAGAKDPL